MSTKGRASSQSLHYAFSLLFDLNLSHPSSIHMHFLQSFFFFFYLSSMHHIIPFSLLFLHHTRFTNNHTINFLSFITFLHKPTILIYNLLFINKLFHKKYKYHERLHYTVFERTKGLL